MQPSQAEKNRVGNYEPPRGVKEKGPTRLYVGSLHFNITQEMLRGIFEPFGPITAIQLIMDPETGRSKGYGFVTVRKDCYKQADTVYFLYMTDTLLFSSSTPTTTMPRRLWSS